jgi:hypothetical protein
MSHATSPAAQATAAAKQLSTPKISRQQQSKDLRESADHPYQAPPVDVAAAPNPGAALSMRPLGVRGYHASTLQDHVEIRMFKREFHNPNELVPTSKSVNLFPHHLEALREVFPTLRAAIKDYHDNAVDPNVFVALGTDGLHVNMNIYCDQLLIHIRYFERCFWEPKSVYPTNKGITLKINELAQLEDEFSALVAAIIP